MPRRALALRTRGRQCIWQRRRQLCPLLPPSQWLLKQLSLSQKHLLFEHCRNTLCTLNRTLECQAQRQAPTAGAGREQQAPAARSWSGGGKPCSARGDRSLHSPRAGWQLPGPYWHLGAPLACTLDPHVVTGAWARVRGKSLPATRGCLQPACSCLAALYGFVGLERHPCHAGKCRWVECPWGCAVGCHGHRGGSTGTELGWAPEHQSQGCLCHPCSVPLRWRVQSPMLRMQPRLKRPSMRCCPVTGWS